MLFAKMAQYSRRLPEISKRLDVFTRIFKALFGFINAIISLKGKFLACQTR